MIEPHPAQRGTSSPQYGFQHMVELLQTLAEGQTQLAQTQQQIHSIVDRILTAIAAQAKVAPQPETPAAKPKIATYEQMYGPLPLPAPVVTPVTPPRRRHWLVRWLVKEERT